LVRCGRARLASGRVSECLGRAPPVICMILGRRSFRNDAPVAQADRASAFERKEPSAGNGTAEVDCTVTGKPQRLRPLATPWKPSVVTTSVR
jgi:hypothetical protein